MGRNAPVFSSRRVLSFLEPKALPLPVDSSAFHSASSKVGGGDRDRFFLVSLVLDTPSSIGSLAFEPAPCPLF
jgi:hypothetical protein